MIVKGKNIFQKKRSLFMKNVIKSFNPTPLVVQEIDRFAQGTQNTLKNLIILLKERPLWVRLGGVFFSSCPFSLGSDPLKVFTRTTFFFVRRSGKTFPKANHYYQCTTIIITIREAGVTNTVVVAEKKRERERVSWNSFFLNSKCGRLKKLPTNILIRKALNPPWVLSVDVVNLLISLKESQYR